ncbi:family 20 glycosylhydrolase [Pedobacter cryophilus]|uniref:beta-N-acetylhexosaminidase n=1 Tax=Pedobacter cryophilus TaxID=2571271 RepID=A0A4U1C729_9SPHI|nr:family 20 glycosylhydrolase [Pedobacter cryophilus]TKB99200.1 beta-N-acetylhexosaminidase [Pedobacter cryophilus]
MKSLISALILLFVVNSGICQNKRVTNNSQLSISWQPIENNYLGKEQALSVFEITNNGNTVLPANGWKLYFNFVRIITPKTEGDKLNVKHLNGDLFFISPAKNFTFLKPGESIRFEIISNSWLVNQSDAPQGFYVVWDNPEKNIELVNQVKILPPLDQRKFYRFGGDKETTPEMLYDQNKMIIDIPESKLTKIFPSPSVYKELQGLFIINSKTNIVYDEEFEKEAMLLGSTLFELTGRELILKKAVGDIKFAINLKKDNLTGEAYKLNVSSTGISIEAGTTAGVFYAIQSLKTLINPSVYSKKNNSTIEIPCVDVEDYPRFGYRAVMLDVARNFQPKAQILKILDLMALYKLNTLHFHLNDDEGWRIEIPALPELTEVSSKRAHLNEGENPTLPPSYGSGPLENKSSGSGYYSKADFIEILRYAAARHIQVIPEIETPGHARSAIKAMDARYGRFLKEGKTEEAKKYLLHDFNDESVYRSVQKWDDNVMDVSMPSVYSFLELVTDEVIAIYKEAGVSLKTIHFGGDEVPNGVWEKSPSYVSLKTNEKGIKETQDLWFYFFDKLDVMLKERGLYLSGWEEVALRKTMLDGKKRWLPNPTFSQRNFHVNVWNNLLGNEDLAYRLANSGYKVILSFVTNFYFDLAYHKNFNEKGFYWGGFTELDKPYSFIPFDYLKNQRNNYLGRPLSQKTLLSAERLTDYGKDNIVGIQGLLWSETIKNADQMEYLLLPRLLSLAEQAWAKSPAWAEETDSVKAAQTYNKELAGFFNLLGKRELKRLDYYAGGFNYRIPTPGINNLDGIISANVQLPGLVIRYTTDGSIPTLKSLIYETPLKANKNLVFRTFNNEGRGSAVSKVQ